MFIDYTTRKERIGKTKSEKTLINIFKVLVFSLCLEIVATLINLSIAIIKTSC